MERPVEKGERRALAGSGERRAPRKTVASFNVGGRERSERARDFRKRQVRKMTRLERRHPSLERSVYGHRLRDERSRGLFQQTAGIGERHDLSRRVEGEPLHRPILVGIRVPREPDEKVRDLDVAVGR